MQGAVAEASFMTGMERNSDIVQLASYAPLFVHTDNRIWPTNMIVFDNHRSTPAPLSPLLPLNLKCRQLSLPVVHFPVPETMFGPFLKEQLLMHTAQCASASCEAPSLLVNQPQQQLCKRP